MNVKELQQLEMLWDRKIFPEKIRMDDGYIYIIEHITLSQYDHLKQLTKVKYKAGNKTIILTRDDLSKIDKVYSVYQSVNING